MEHEIADHAKKAFKAMHDHEKPFWEKTKEVLFEILIIVFAVTFAAFIERTREDFKEKAEAKAFVIGLKGDLVNAIKDIKSSQLDMDTVVNSYAFFDTLKQADIGDIIKNRHSLSFNIPRFNTQLQNGRYEGFKSSGKIQTIENDSLRNDILKLYQVDVPYVMFAESAFNDNQKRLEDFIINGPGINDYKESDVLKLLTTNKAKLLLTFSQGYSNGVRNSYKTTLKQAEKIKKEIDKEYH